MSTSEHDQDRYDLIVVGGGPAGSTLATFVAMQGHRVLLLEKERFPRYQIGESLLPGTVHGICKLLGVYDEIVAANFTPKNGGTFRWGNNPEPWSFSFADASVLKDARAVRAFQVERMKFDDILLKNARRRGVEVREQCTVTEVLSDNGRVTGVRFEDRSGSEVRDQVAHGRYVADAAGNTSRLYERIGTRVYSKFFQNVALFGYFEGGKRLPEPRSGNILCAAFDIGWIWYIPLSPSLTSVGVVVSRDHAKGLLQQDREVAITHCINACPVVKDYLAEARRVTEGPYGELRIRRDWSYTTTKSWAPGMVLVGDSFGFIDPLFSQGVHLATYSALLASRSINTCLAGGDIPEDRCFDEYEFRYRKEYKVFYDFLTAFYDMHKDRDSYFWDARTILNSPDQANEAFINLVAGTSNAAGDFFGIQAPADESSDGAPEQLTALRKTVHTTGNELEMQAKTGTGLPSENLESGAGLVRSSDGFHWKEPDV